MHTCTLVWGAVARWNSDPLRSTGARAAGAWPCFHAFLRNPRWSLTSSWLPFMGVEVTDRRTDGRIWLWNFQNSPSVCNRTEPSPVIRLCVGSPVKLCLFADVECASVRLCVRLQFLRAAADRADVDNYKVLSQTRQLWRCLPNISLTHTPSSAVQEPQHHKA